MTAHSPTASAASKTFDLIIIGGGFALAGSGA